MALLWSFLVFSKIHSILVYLPHCIRAAISKYVAALLLCPRKALFHSLQGQQVVIPDIEKLLVHWPRAVNPNIQVLEDVVDTKFKE